MHPLPCLRGAARGWGFVFLKSQLNMVLFKVTTISGNNIAAEVIFLGTCSKVE